MLFKLLYLPSALNMTYYSSACDSALHEPTGDDSMIKSHEPHLFSVLIKKLIKNRQNAIKTQIDTILP
jgi:hypothetical protein